MQTDKLKSLFKEQEKLVGQLDRSLALQAIWPSVFEHGQAKTQVSGIISQNSLKFTITRGDGQTKSFDLKTEYQLKGNGHRYRTVSKNDQVDELLKDYTLKR